MLDEKDKIWWIYSTFPQRAEALSIALELLEKNLIACANITENVLSLYHWEGQIQEENEVVLIAKTSTEQLPHAMETLKTYHPYDIPCIVAFPLETANTEFQQWVKQQTKG